MNELSRIIPVEEDAELTQTVNARDLWKFLESKQEFSNWIKSRIEQFGFEENQDFIVVDKIINNSAEGRRPVDFHISLDMAKELSMVERNEKGKEARKYFIECEKQARKQLSPAEFLVQQAQMLLEQERRTKALELEQKRQQEQLTLIQDRMGRLDGSDGYMTVRGYCQVNNIKVPIIYAQQIGKDLSRLCRERGYIKGQTADERYGQVGTYPVCLMDEYFIEE